MRTLKSWYIFPSFGAAVIQQQKKIRQNSKVLISENDYCGFVGNVEVDSGLTLYTHKPLFDRSGTYLNFENG